jgi:hypothetical protein
VPFSRHPLDYPINRLMLRVGMALQSWLVHQPPLRDQEKRRAVEAALTREFGLDEAVKAGLLRTYHFRWNRDGELRTIHLVPANRVRRTPGLKAMHQIFFKGRWR